MSDFADKFGHGVEDALSLKSARDSVSNAYESAKKALGVGQPEKQTGPSLMTQNAIAGRQEAADKAKATPQPKKSSMPKYEDGTDFVPETGPAILHKGEAVLPKHEAQQHRAKKAKFDVGKSLGDKGKKEIKHIVTRKAGKGHIHVHVHSSGHPDEEHATQGDDAMVDHLLQHMGTPNPGEAEADAGNAGLPSAGGATQPQAPPSAAPAGV